MSLIPLHSGRPAGLSDFVSGNAGLRYDKYIDVWANSERSSVAFDLPSLNEEGKTDFFRSAATTCGDAEELTSYLDRRHRLLGKLRGRVLRGPTLWRFISGLGGPHPMETGFTWHRTLGVPYLPGSSVKGMMRAWVRDWLGQEELAEELFGVADNESSTYGMGRFIVFDAIPMVPVKLEVDIMNPHYPDYYKDESEKTAPSDDQSPKPVQFLAVAANQRFEFAIAPSSDRCSDHDLDRAVSLLTDAAYNIGCGAKTAVGYGVFRLAPPPEEDDPVRKFVEEQTQQNIAELSPFEQMLLPLRQFLDPRGSALTEQQVHDTALDVYRQLDALNDDEKLEAARILRDVWTRRRMWPTKQSKKNKQWPREQKVREILGVTD